MKIDNIRIRRKDKLNLIIEIYIPEHVSEHGKTKGELVEGRWILFGYYGNSLSGLAKGMISAVSQGFEINNEELVISELQQLYALEMGLLEKMEKLLEGAEL